MSHPSPRPYQVCPADFDPNAAEPGVLAGYGYPPRPDPDLAPALHRHWQRMFGGPRKIIALPSGGTPRPHRLWPMNGPPSPWAGATVEIEPLTEKGTVVAVTFNVPDVVPQATDPGQDLGFWVGLMNPQTDFICQAGIGCNMDWIIEAPPGNSAYYPFYYPFTQFYPDEDNEQTIGLPSGSGYQQPFIQGGQQVSILVTGPGAWGPDGIDYGFAFVHNVATGEVLTSPIDPADAADETAVGRLAGCIVERPGLMNTGDLPNFGTVNFTGFEAGTVQQTTSLAGAKTYEISNGTSGNVLTATTVPDDSSVTVTWEVPA